MLALYFSVQALYNCPSGYSPSSIMESQNSNSTQKPEEGPEAETLGELSLMAASPRIAQVPFLYS